MQLQEARSQLSALQAKMFAYRHALGLISYDGATTAPKNTAANRARTLPVLSGEVYRLATGPETVSLLEFLDAHRDELTAKEQRQVFLLLKDLRFMQKIPMDEFLAYRRLLVESDDVWHRAKAADDFASFAPYLEQIFDAKKRFAAYAAPEKDPYDYWLNEYETGLDRRTCDAFFAAVHAGVVPLLKKVLAAPPVSDACLLGDFPEPEQEALAYYLMDLIGLDRGHVGLSTTEHPFTTSLGSHFDTRITTHYYRGNVSYSLFSVVHEGGHALYETGCADDLAYTVLDGGVSMSIHESQSRFYENLIARSLPFVRTIFPKVQELFPQQMAGVTAEDFWKAVNKAQPSLIRTKADELTYCLHVMVRYELEKRLMAGDLAVPDLPAAWNALYKEYLGVDVPDDTRGVLQDSHWGGGMVGYFPSYALGSAYGAQILARMKETVDVDACLARGDLKPINDWNREHIWQYGKLYPPQELLERVLGGPFDPGYYVRYLEEKYTQLYGLR
ncbi:MAG: carboxypeptidase M32 [Lachnospiraceae bacterium]|nr:carboxypeptidase M32 [Lachnospiraceae bacterium]